MTVNADEQSKEKIMEYVKAVTVYDQAGCVVEPSDFDYQDEAHLQAAQEEWEQMHLATPQAREWHTHAEQSARQVALLYEAGLLSPRAMRRLYRVVNSGWPLLVETDAPNQTTEQEQWEWAKQQAEVARLKRRQNAEQETSDD